jgi:hypothetical protein
VNRCGLGPLIVCLVLLGGAPSPQAQTSAQSDPIRRVRSPIAGRYIVSLRGNDDPARVGLESAKLYRGRLRRAYRRALQGFSIDLTETAARALARDPRIAYVQEDGITTADAVSEQVALKTWGLDRIDQRARPLDDRYRHSSNGTGVNVYVIDSGIRTTHVSFQGRAFAAHNALGDGTPSDVDCNGHGTHVAGIVGSDDVGVAKGVLLYSVKALGCDNLGTWSAYIEAIDWVVANHRKPAVINASIGGGFVPAAADAIKAAVDAGVTFVGSAGNENSDACGRIPGGAPEAITVGNSTADDERASDSNHGPCVAVFAPGGLITSAYNTGDTDYATMWGTSMAAPHVAGAAALYLERHPAATPSEVRSAILAGATPGVLTNHVPGSPNLLLFSPYLGDVVDPTLAIASPAPGSVVKGIVTVRASAADDVELAAVRFSVAGTSLGTHSAPPFAVSWNTTQFTNATHTLTVEAVDRAGNVTRRTITVTVSNDGEQQGWSTGAIGQYGSGQASYNSSSLVLEGTGTDVWGTADDFYFARHRLTGDGDIVARISSLDRPAGAQFAMAGLMFRESADSGSRHASVVITTEGKLKFRRRTTGNGPTFSDGPSAGTTWAPKWLKLSRRGNVFSAYVSDDGDAWSSVHSSATIAMPAALDVGVLALHTGGSGFARATFENVGVGRVPDGWGIADVGPVGGPGRTITTGDVFALDAAGTDLWSTRDAFHLAYRRWTGDGEVIAMVESIGKPSDSSFALAAITMRESLRDDARHASLALTTDGKAKFRRRTAVGGNTSSDGPSAGSIVIPRWVRLTRLGQEITAYTSPDGVQWQRVHTTQAVAMPPSIYIGMLGLRNGGSGSARVRFSRVTIRSFPIVAN